MLFSVVIPTCRRYTALRDCLEALRPDLQAFPETDYEVIVSDDTDRNRREPDPAPGLPYVQVVEGPRRGPASNRNCGASHASGDWLFFVDDDCVPEPGFLRGYQNAIATHPDCRVFEGCTTADRPKARMDEESPITDLGGFLWSCNFAIRRDVFERLGGFCEAFPYAAMEDVDFRLRVVAAGESFLFVPHARVMHPWRPVSTATKLARIHLVSNRIFYSRHPEGRPTFLGYLRIIARDYWNQLTQEGPRYRFRGLGRWLWSRFLLTLAELRLALDSLTAGKS